MSSGSFALYPMSFYQLQPVYLCRSASSTEWETCKPEEFCDKPEVEYKVDAENSLSLDNWVIEYGMTCSPKYYFGLFGSLFFIAVLVSSLVFTPLADRFGRRVICLCGLALTIVAQAAMLFSTSRNLTYALVFLLGLALPMRNFVGYIYSMEFLPTSKTKQITAMNIGFDGLVPLVGALWFMYVSKDWKTLFAFATGLVCLTFVVVLAMPESPKHLVARGKYSEARAVMTRIARYNGLQSFNFSEHEKANF